MKSRGQKVSNSSYLILSNAHSIVDFCRSKILKYLCFSMNLMITASICSINGRTLKSQSAALLKSLRKFAKLKLQLSLILVRKSKRLKRNEKKCPVLTTSASIHRSRFNERLMIASTTFSLLRHLSRIKSTTRTT